MDDEDFNEPEVVHRLDYDAEEDRWDSSPREVKVAVQMFAQGDRMGCIMVQDLHDNKTYVIKKPFDSEAPGATTTAIYEHCKVRTVAIHVAAKYNKLKPRLMIGFLPCFVYILAERPGQPAVIVEPVVLNHSKSRVSPATANSDRDAIESFEHFSFHMSRSNFVMCNAQQVSDGRWTEPEYHSVDGAIGGDLNGGQGSIDKWMIRHQENDVCRKLNLGGLFEEEDEEEEEEDDADDVADTDETLGSNTQATRRPQPAPPPAFTPRSTAGKGITCIALVGVSDAPATGGLGWGGGGGAKSVRVHSVAAGSQTLKQGFFKAGDRILSVDGVNTVGFPVQKVRKMLEGDAGTKVRIEYERDGKMLLQANVTRVPGKVVRGRYREHSDTTEDAVLAPIAPLLAPALATAQTLTTNLEKFAENPLYMLFGEHKKEGPVPPPDGRIVGTGCEPRVGLRVEMLPSYVKRGIGTITEVNDKGGYVAVQWDDGRSDPCLGFRDEQFVREARRTVKGHRRSSLLG